MKKTLLIKTGEAMRSRVTAARGLATGLLLVAFAGVLMMTTIAVVRTQRQQLGAEAQIRNESVRLQVNTLKLHRVSDQKIEIEGNFCFSTLLRSGTENWSAFVTDNAGRDLADPQNSAHVDTGRLSAGPSFPGVCNYVNRETGEAELIDANTKDPATFNLIATFKQKITSTNCPIVYLNYRGTKHAGVPFAKVDLSKFPGICQPAATPTSVATATPSPIPGTPTTIPTTVPTATPTPSFSSSLSGKVSVYSCQKPQSVEVTLCKNEDCSETRTITLGSSAQPDGVWLDDPNTDNTWIYRYSINKDQGSNPLTSGTNYTLKGAKAYFSGSAYNSELEEKRNLIVKPGQPRDFKVYANRTCGCPFNSVAYIKDASGRFITELDNQNGIYGMSNNKQIFRDGDKPVFNMPFKGGKIDVHTDNFVDYENNVPLDIAYGKDALATVKVHVPGWKVLRQECKSKNPDVPACPTYENNFSKGADEVFDASLFENLRVTCGTDLEYGWVLEKLPPSPTPVPSNQPTGNADFLEVGLALFIHEKGAQPDSCELAKIYNDINKKGYSYLENPCTLRVQNQTTGQKFEQYLPVCNKAHKFMGIPAGTYKIKVDFPASSVDLDGYLKDAPKCKDQKTVTIGVGQRLQRAVVVEFDPQQCQEGNKTEKAAACSKLGGEKLANLSTGDQKNKDVLCCVNKNKSSAGGGGGSSGGSGGGTGGGGGSVPPYYPPDYYPPADGGGTGGGTGSGEADDCYANNGEGYACFMPNDCVSASVPSNYCQGGSVCCNALGDGGDGSTSDGKSFCPKASAGKINDALKGCLSLKSTSDRAACFRRQLEIELKKLPADQQEACIVYGAESLYKIYVGACKAKRVPDGDITTQKGFVIDLKDCIQNPDNCGKITETINKCLNRAVLPTRRPEPTRKESSESEEERPNATPTRSVGIPDRLDKDIISTFIYGYMDPGSDPSWWNEAYYRIKLFSCEDGSVSANGKFCKPDKQIGNTIGTSFAGSPANGGCKKGDECRYDKFKVNRNTPYMIQVDKFNYSFTSIADSLIKDGCPGPNKTFYNDKCVENAVARCDGDHNYTGEICVGGKPHFHLTDILVAGTDNEQRDVVFGITKVNGQYYGRVTFSERHVPDFAESGDSRTVSFDSDLDNNGIVNTLDYLLVIEQYGSSLQDGAGLNEITSDINEDGIVNALDVSLIIDNFGNEAAQ